MTSDTTGQPERLTEDDLARIDHEARANLTVFLVDAVRLVADLRATRAELRRLEGVVEALRVAVMKLHPEPRFCVNVGSWPFWYCELCDARHENKEQIIHADDCVFALVATASTEQEGT